jgi:hypothetical protein
MIPDSMTLIALTGRGRGGGRTSEVNWKGWEAESEIVRLQAPWGSDPPKVKIRWEQIRHKSLNTSVRISGQIAGLTQLLRNAGPKPGVCRCE